jgi:predicted alpha/beta-fold hydrolase
VVFFFAGYLQIERQMAGKQSLKTGDRISVFQAIRGQIQTLAPHFFRRVNLPPAERIEIPLRDGDFVDADFRKGDGRGLAILSHGLEGSSDAVYIRSITKSYLHRGWDVLAWNFRGCSGRRNRLHRLYNSGAVEDLQDVVSYGSSNLKPNRIQLAGFSLGGNLTLLCLGRHSSWLAEHGVEKALAVSVPLNLAATSAKIDKWWNMPYSNVFLRNLKSKIYWKEEQFPGYYPLEQIKKSKSLWEFDDNCTAPLHGFESADDYYRKCSCLYVIPQIQIPTLVVIAKNDPILARGNYEEVLQMNPKVEFLITEEGGHCGFWGMNVF